MDANYEARSKYTNMSETAVLMVGSALLCCSLGAIAAEPAAKGSDESENFFHLGGYVRTWASFNLRDVPDTAKNDQGNLSMLRGSLLLNAEAKTGPVRWTAIGRADREYKTEYIQRLEDLTKLKTPGGPGSHVMDQYNQGELREFYADIDVNDRVHLRLGKQQVVWGETDFFHAMDMVHGFDFRWRSFLEGEPDELRKPLILANASIQIPEANGALQVLVRPGLDRVKDIGNTYDLYGGRWTSQTFMGADFINAGATMGYDFRHPDGNTKDTTGGLRWKGTAGPLTYSAAYLTTFNPDPIANSAFGPYMKTPTNPFGDWIFPKIHLIGVTASGYVPLIDSVLSTEIVSNPHAPYNFGLDMPGSKFQPFGPRPLGSLNTIPGFGGVIKKNTLTTMFRLDKNLNLKSLLGTSGDSFFSVQLFDKWITNFDPAYEIGERNGYNAPRDKHAMILTTILATNFKSGTINPTLAVGFDLNHAGGFVIPSVDFVFGDKWRLKVEADLFWYGRDRKPNIASTSGVSETDAHLFGGLAHHDQLLFRLTRQF